MNKNDELFEMENLFLALADKTRLRLLNLMRSGEICVNSLTEILAESQPKVSRHLAYLRSAKIVEARRDGKQMLYRISEPDDESAARILNNTLDWLKTLYEMRMEFDKLTQIISPVNNAAPDAIEENNIYAKADNHQTKKELEIFLL